MNNLNITEKLLKIGCKIWEKNDIKRIYMTCEQFNEVTGREYSLNDKNNKIFYDFKANAIMRTYKRKTKVEVQF